MTPEYFKRELRPYEADHYLDGMYMRFRAGWEQSRMICNHWRSKDSEPIVYPWDEKPEAPTRKEIDDVLQWSAQATEYLNSKHG